MDELYNLAQILALLVSSHEGSHNAIANELQVPIEWNIKRGAWYTPEKDKRRLSEISGAGFQGQDKASYMMKDKNTSLLSALHKISYLLKDREDLGTLEKASGNKYIPEILGATILSDLMKYDNQKQNWSLGFSTFGTGQPGLIYNQRF